MKEWHDICNLKQNYKQKIKIMNLKNLVVKHDEFNYKGLKLLTKSNCTEYSNLAELHKILIDIKNDTQFHKVDKHHLPYTLTTTTGYGFLKGQKGYANYLILDIDDGITRKEVEAIFARYEYISYFSFSNGLKANERFRIIIKLDRPYHTEEIKSIKYRLINEFPFADINSFKRNTLMYLPVFYEGSRDPFIEYNKGVAYSLENFITEEKNVKDVIDTTTIEKHISYTTSKLDNIEYDKDKQDIYVNKVLNSYEHKNTHNWLFSSMVKLLSAGIDKNEVVRLLSPFETREHKGKVLRDINTNVTINPYFYNTKNNIKLKSKILKAVSSEDKDTDNNIYTVDKYLTELQNVLLKKLNIHKKILIQGDTNIGKTYLFTHLPEKQILILLPTVNLVYQLTAKLNIYTKNFDYVIAGRRPNLSQNLIIGTYDSIKKFNTSEGLEWLKNATLVVDEAHNITASSNYSYRQNVMQYINDTVAKEYVYLTATPILNNTIKGFKHIVVQKTIRRNKELNIVFYKDMMKSLLSRLDKNEKQVIFLNDKRKLEQINVFLINKGYNTQVITSDTIEDNLLFVETGSINDDVDVLLTTQILAEGFRIKNNIDKLHILSQIPAEFIHQMSERPTNNATKETYIYINENKSLFSSNWSKFNKNKYRNSLITEAKSIIEFNTKQESLINEMIKVNETRLGEIEHEYNDFKFNKFINYTRRSFIEGLSDNIRNIVRDGYKEINILGIEYEVFIEENKFLWSNIPLLMNKLASYNFTIKDIYNEDVVLNEDETKELKESKETAKQQEEKKIDMVLTYIEKGGVPEKEDEAMYNECLYKTESLEKFYNIDIHTAVAIIRQIGTSNRTFNNLKNKISYSFTDINLRNLFNTEKYYTASEINNIINQYRNKYTGYKKPLSETKSTQIFKDIFEVKAKYTNADKTRTYKIISNESYKNVITNVAIKLDDIITDNFNVFNII